MALDSKDSLPIDWVQQKAHVLSQGIVAWTEQNVMEIVDNPLMISQEKNLVQYEFPFVSGKSGLTLVEQNIVEEQLWNNAVKVRVYCIRHGMSVEEEWGKNLQKDEAELCEWAKEQYREIAQELQRLWVNKENTYLRILWMNAGNKGETSDKICWNIN